MKYWTIQTIEAWNQALKKGFFIGNPQYIYEDFLDSYLWMMNERKSVFPIIKVNFQPSYGLKGQFYEQLGS